VKPVTLPPGRERLATSPVATGSPADAITIGIVRCRVLRRLDRWREFRNDDTDLEPDELRRQCVDAVGPSLGRSPFDNDVLPFYVPVVSKALAELLLSDRCHHHEHQHADSRKLPGWRLSVCREARSEN
jgi:hypothetical protein